MKRRYFLATTGAAAAAAFSPSTTSASPAINSLNQAELPYAFEALEPHIDADTMSIHFGRHHVAYINNLKAAMEGAGISNDDAIDLCKNIPSLPEAARQAVRNNGGGHVNHTLFWKWMIPAGKGPAGPEGKLGAAIQSTFGSIDDFKKLFAEKGTKQFGSGWAWLIVRPDGSLKVTSTPNQDNPYMKGIVADEDLGTPILGLDVWEHAYYLKYQNKRPDYIAAWWNVVDWNQVSAQYAQAKM